MTTPYLRRYYAGGGTSTNLSNAMGAFDGSFVINSDTGWPGSPGNSGGFIVVVDRGTSSEEKIRCSSNSGTTVTVASDGNGGRGYDGTSATSHNANASVSLCGGAIDFDEANQVVTQVLGQSGAAKGDILTMLSAAGPNTLTRVPIGSAGQLLGVASGLPAWETPGYALSGTPVAVGLSDVESYIGSSVVLTTASTIYNIASVSLATGTWLLTACVVAYNSSSSPVGSDWWLGPTSTSVTGVYASGSANFTAAASGGNVQTLCLTTIITLGTTTTVYLEGETGASSAVTALHQSLNYTIGNATGISAVRIA